MVLSLRVVEISAISPLVFWQERMKSTAELSLSPYGPDPGRWPRVRNACTQRAVIPGWPMSIVGKEPSRFCLDAIHSKARSTERSTILRSAGEITEADEAGSSCGWASAGMQKIAKAIAARSRAGL